MSYKTLLVHLDDTPRCATRVRIAAALAALHGSHLVGLAPTGLVNLPAEVGWAVLGDLQEELRRSATQLADGFAHQAGSSGLVSFEASVLEDEPLPAVVMRARCSDLVVLGQTDPDADRPLVARDFPQQVLLQAGRPVLLVPRRGDFETPGQRVLLAWSPGRETARAVSDALPFLQRARQVHLVLIDTSRAPDGAPRHQLGWVRAWLRGHGVATEAEVIPSQTDPGLVLLAEAAKRRADLLVMGGYGHSRAAEFVFGGTTRTVLSQMDLPVLMSH
ncbi:universal stress protein [Aquabacterium sp. A7-Y]|uniref:universal stress protein n=1 Tax=Aquabacterium sp. A7-Y TaxID=1349605 RepID=UPI00223DF4EB|nr:universal stress protein [Aquabacterium sp. A7-Y]MCW7540900.1 universal stress protein [Aquabacterium sp. A7-Y]